MLVISIQKTSISFPFLKIVLQVTLIAQGDVPLSIVMTVCTTLGAVILTPLLTKILAGTYVPVNAVHLSMSTLQVMSALCSTPRFHFCSIYLIWSLPFRIGRSRSDSARFVSPEHVS